MSTLKLKAQSILDEKNNKIKPENIKAGIQVFDVVGTLQEGINTDDATARGYDMAEGKTAYVGGKKIEGTISDYRHADGTYGEVSLGNSTVEYTENWVVGGTLSVFTTPDQPAIVDSSNRVKSTVYAPAVAEAIGLTADKIVVGNTILAIEGTAEVGMDTSDATAMAEDITQGKTAYVNGELITGTLPVAETYTRNMEYVNMDDNTRIYSFGGQNYTRQVLSETAQIWMEVPYDTIIANLNLSANKIQAGNTILGINGTAPVTFATVEEMESNTNFAENTLAIVYGTEYIGTYKLDAGIWTQIGEATSGVEMMNVLNLVDENIEEYEGNGGTDEEINAVLEDILTNPNTEIGPDEDPLPWG